MTTPFRAARLLVLSVALVAPLLTALPAQAAITADATVPSPTGFTQLTVGGNHSCGLTADSTAWCWGDDSSGQLGNGATTGIQASPSAVDMSLLPAASRFTQLTAGSDHTCGLTADGTAWCWGYDDFGQLGNGATAGSQASPSAVDMSLLPAGTRFTQLTAGYLHTCGITADGTAWCWGWDDSGQLGNGATSGNQTSPSAVNTTAMPFGTRFTQLTTDGAHTCGLTAHGTAWCWGDDYSGQLGNGATSGSQASPSAVDMSPLPTGIRFSHLTAGGTHTCGLATDGTAWCWGWDGDGQLGNGAATNDQASPTAVDMSPLPTGARFTQLTAGVVHTCGLATDGTAWCWGDDYSGQLGNGTTTRNQDPPSAVAMSPLPPGSRFTQLTAGNYLTCALTAGGTAWCWGSDYHGQLGNGATTADQAVPSPVDTTPLPTGTHFTQLTAGDNHTCGLTADGTAWCWGNDDNGELGNGATTGNQASPTAVDISPLPAGTRFTQLTAGAYHTCGLTAAGAAWCWGNDDSGQLGNGNGPDATGNQTSPSPVVMPAATRFTQLTTGFLHTCGLTAAGATWCWGDDRNGQLGNGDATTGDRISPSEVVMPTGIRFTQLTTGFSHTCGLAADGTAWCWGNDSNGELGNGNATGIQASPSAVVMPPGTTFAQLTAGDSHTCGPTADGTAWCWGSDSNGQLGNGAATTGNQASPSAVDMSLLPGGARFTQLAGGYNHTCGLTADGTARCWGNDDRGQLGNGATAGNQASPSAVDTAVTAVDATVTGNLGDNVTLDPQVDGVGPVSMAWTNPAAASTGTATDLTLPVTIASADYGTWTVTATNAFNRSVTATITLTSIPTARITGPTNVTSGGTANLDGTGSSSDDGAAITAHRWDLDDDGVFGETGAGATRGNETDSTPTFSAAGLPAGSTHPVALQVTTANYTSAIATRTLTITSSGSGGSGSQPAGTSSHPAPTETGNGTRYGPVDAGPGDTLDTATGNPRPLDVAVTVPSSTRITIGLGPTDPSGVNAPAGTELAGTDTVVTLEPPTTSPSKVTLTPRDGLFTPGADLSTLTVLHNGAPVPPCAGTNPDDPCIFSAGPGGVTVHTSRSATFTLAVTATDPTAVYCNPTYDGTNQFTDIPANSPHRLAIECLADGNVITGTSDTTFNPAGTLTRAQAASLLNRAATALGITLPQDHDANFGDVPETSPHRDAIDRLARAGIITGTSDTTFAPGAPITRAQFAALALRLFTAATGTTPLGPDAFTDDDTSIFEPVLNQAAAIGLLTGNNRQITPGTPVTRDQAAAIIARLLGRLTPT